MSGQYKKVKNDGALWRCKDCNILNPHNRVILFIPVEGEPAYSPQGIICLDCVDKEWLKNATCIGEI